MVSSMPRFTRAFGPSLFAVLCILAAGCGSSSTQTSQVRFINAVPNGGTAAFYANGAFAGNQTFFSQTPYEAVGTGEDVFSFTLSNDLGTAYAAVNSTLANGHSYTVIAMGRADDASGTTGYPKLQVVPDDTTTPPAGDIRLRIFMVAPDLSGVNVLVNGATDASNVSYPSLGSDIDVISGNLTIQAVNATGGGAETSAVTFTGIITGHHYTAFVVETATTPTYGIELIDDTTNTLLAP